MEKSFIRSFVRSRLSTLYACQGMMIFYCRVREWKKRSGWSEVRWLMINEPFVALFFHITQQITNIEWREQRSERSWGAEWMNVMKRINSRYISAVTFAIKYLNNYSTLSNASHFIFNDGKPQHRMNFWFLFSFSNITAVVEVAKEI